MDLDFYYVIDIFSKYAWIVPLKDKKGISIVNAFQKILKESNKKPKKIWVEKKGEFYSNSFKKWLKDNDIEIYSIHNEDGTQNYYIFPPISKYLKVAYVNDINYI